MKQNTKVLFFLQFKKKISHIRSTQPNEVTTRISVKGKIIIVSNEMLCSNNAAIYYFR